MQTHKAVRDTSKGSKIQKVNKIVTQNDLIELVLEPLADQIDRARLETISAIQKVGESAEIIAREVARRSE